MCPSGFNNPPQYSQLVWEVQVALALSQSVKDASTTRTRSEDEDLAAAKRQSLHMVSKGSRAEALSYQYWDSNW